MPAPASRKRAERKAYTRLRMSHPDEFAAYIAEAMGEEGYTHKRPPRPAEQLTPIADTRRQKEQPA